MRSVAFIPKKSLGQHFLTDPNIARKIVSTLAPQPGETVVEIGPGNGALTGILLDTGTRLIAMDIDGRAIDNLRTLFAGREANLTLLHGDVLTADFTSLAGTGILRIIGNLPYHLTSPILFHLIDHRTAIRDAVIMIQREVAARICASPRTKDYGILSVMLQLHADVRIGFHVPPHVFYPKPKVDSSVVTVRFTGSRVAEIRDYGLFRSIVRGTFGMRRKTLLNGLRSLGLPPEVVQTAGASLLRRRPEELSVGEFIALSNTLAAAVSNADSPGQDLTP